MIKLTPLDTQVHFWINPDEIVVLEEHFPITSEGLLLPNQAERYTVVLLKNNRNFAVKETGEQILKLWDDGVKEQYNKLGFEVNDTNG